MRYFSWNLISFFPKNWFNIINNFPRTLSGKDGELKKIHSLINSFSSSRSGLKTFGSGPKMPPQLYIIDIRVHILLIQNESLLDFFTTRINFTQKLKRTGGYYVSGKKKQGICILLLYVFITVSLRPEFGLVMWTTGPDTRLYQSIHYT